MWHKRLPGQVSQSACVMMTPLKWDTKDCQVSQPACVMLTPLQMWHKRPPGVPACLCHTDTSFKCDTKDRQVSQPACHADISFKCDTKDCQVSSFACFMLTPLSNVTQKTARCPSLPMLCWHLFQIWCKTVRCPSLPVACCHLFQMWHKMPMLMSLEEYDHVLVCACVCDCVCACVCAYFSKACDSISVNKTGTTVCETGYALTFYLLVFIKYSSKADKWISFMDYSSIIVLSYKIMCSHLVSCDTRECFIHQVQPFVTNTQTLHLKINQQDILILKHFWF